MKSHQQTGGNVNRTNVYFSPSSLLVTKKLLNIGKATGIRIRDTYEVSSIIISLSNKSWMMPSGEDDDIVNIAF